MKITQRETEIVNTYFRENPTRVANCCARPPQITVERTPWGAPGIIVKCSSCGKVSTGMGEDHIQALTHAIEHWNHRYIRSVMESEEKEVPRISWLIRLLVKLGNASFALSNRLYDLTDRLDMKGAII